MTSHRTFGCLLATLMACSALPASAAAPMSAPPTTESLRQGWQLRSSAAVTAGGAEISRPGYPTAGWTAASVPTTVLAALVASGEYRDPYHGRNLEKIPAERFAVPWWYRREIVVGQLTASSRLVFHGVNYSAEVWLNGERIAGRDQITGAFRRFELDVSGRLRPGANGLAVLVYPPQPGDFTIGFVDWNPEPPDRSLGIWREVELRRTGAASLEDVFVRSDFDVVNPTTADLTIEARLVNHGDAPFPALLVGRLAGGARFSYQVELAPGEQRQLRLTPAEVPALRLRAPRLWWPNNLGEPHLYRLELGLHRRRGEPSEPSDQRTVEFGIRKVADAVDEHGYRGYTINGKPVLIRGGGWADDLMLADDDRRLEDQIRYARHLNLNTIRLEGFWGTTQRLYELADRFGLMVWVGWSCQWEWQPYLRAPVDESFGGVDTPAEMDLVATSLRDQVLRLRNHPSVVVWNLASDLLPRPELERRYRALLAEIDPTRPPLAACSVRTSEVSGPTGVKMNGPYEWVPPNYWYVDKEHGGAFGFNTETGPGAQPPPASVLRRMLPQEHWWPIDEMWDYHSGR
ncbi:MAG TPA: glycoside hydrolase family 2 TIM barrel-domain containing protein, partial [Thermoanaerobaculia bacterium]|nr:glycoside hydrolase family 2 TIM barrel-domain containing protein [Thermoanaerobaculia bacterium]